MIWIDTKEEVPYEGEVVIVEYFGEVTLGYWHWEEPGDYEYPLLSYKQWSVLNDNLDDWIIDAEAPDYWMRLPAPHGGKACS